MQEEVGKLLVGKRSVFFLIAVIGPLGRRRAERGRKRWISDHHTDLLLHLALFAGFKETAGVDALFLQFGEELDTGADFLRLQSIAEGEAKAEGGEFHSPFFQVDAVDTSEQLLEDRFLGTFPVIPASPVEHKAFVGLDEEDAGSASRIQDDLVFSVQPVQSLPTEHFSQHEPHEKRWRINGHSRVTDEKLVDVADEFDGKVRKGVALPKRQLAASLLLSFDQTGERRKLSAVAQGRAVLLAEAEDVTIESFLKVFQQVNKRGAVCQHLKELRRSGSEAGEIIVLEYFPCLKIGDQQREDEQFAPEGLGQDAFLVEVFMEEFDFLDQRLLGGLSA